MTAQAGIVDRDGRGLGVVAADLDADGKTDLFVANDTTANFFFHNQGGFRFTEEGLESGLATNAGGGYLAGMGIACGDFDGDGLLDLAVTNFYGESTTLYHNLGERPLQRPDGRGGPGGPNPFRAGLRPGRARRQQRRQTRPGPGQRAHQRLSSDHALTPCRRSSSSATGRASSTTSPRRPAHPGRSFAWRAGWRPATSTTTAASTCCWYPRTNRLLSCATEGASEPGTCSGSARALPDAPARGNGLQSRWCRRTGRADRCGEKPDRPAIRWRQLPLGKRPPAPFRPGGCQQG